MYNIGEGEISIIGNELVKKACRKRKWLSEIAKRRNLANLSEKPYQHLGQRRRKAKKISGERSQASSKTLQYLQIEKHLGKTDKVAAAYRREQHDVA
jgi:hypothetical protein